ncbi:MAG: spore maturation protein [Firmicutes bacterium]|nr:spore maturation protein [Bacillota bacterium]
MKLVTMMSDLMIPLIFVGIITYGLLQRVNVLESFFKGALKGVKVVFDIFPTFLSLVVAVGVFQASGALQVLTGLLQPVGEAIHMPSPLIPIAMTKFISSSASTGLVLQLFKDYGPDSLEGIMTSIMIGSTETILYTMSVYFSAAKVEKTRYTLPGAIISNLAGIGASVMIAHWMMN